MSSASVKINFFTYVTLNCVHTELKLEPVVYRKLFYLAGKYEAFPWVSL